MCFFVAVFCLARDKSLGWKGMLILLFFICAAETAGIYIKGKYVLDRVNVRPNIWVYNLLMIFQAAFISGMFASLLKQYRNLSLVIFSGLSLLIVLYMFDLFNHGIYVKHVNTYLVMSVLFIIYSLIYFYLLLRDDTLRDLKYEPGFWWVAGTLFFFFGSVMATLFYETIRDTAPLQGYVKYIYYALNVVLYGCWSYAFILRKWSTQKFVTSL